VADGDEEKAAAAADLRRQVRDFGPAGQPVADA
jgi:hypothetical protein